MDDTALSNNAIKSLPPLEIVKGFKYDEICVRLCFSVKIKTKHDASVLWSWYVLAGDREPDGDWKFWGLVSKKQTDFEEFRLSELRLIAESWNSELVWDTGIEFTPLSQVIEKLGFKWSNNDG